MRASTSRARRWCYRPARGASARARTPAAAGGPRRGASPDSSLRFGLWSRRARSDSAFVPASTSRSTPCAGSTGRTERGVTKVVKYCERLFGGKRHVTGLLDPRLAWTEFVPAEARALWRKMADRHAASRGAEFGVRAAEGMVDAIYSVAAWLREEHRIPADAARLLPNGGSRSRKNGRSEPGSGAAVPTVHATPSRSTAGSSPQSPTGASTCVSASRSSGQRSAERAKCSAALAGCSCCRSTCLTTSGWRRQGALVRSRSRAPARSTARSSCSHRSNNARRASTNPRSSHTCDAAAPVYEFATIGSAGASFALAIVHAAVGRQARCAATDASVAIRTAAAITRTAVSISSGVVYRPSESRSVPMPHSGATPIARNTGES